MIRDVRMRTIRMEIKYRYEKDRKKIGELGDLEGMKVDTNEIKDMSNRPEPVQKWITNHTVALES